MRWALIGSLLLASSTVTGFVSAQPPPAQPPPAQPPPPPPPGGPPAPSPEAPPPAASATALDEDPPYEPRPVELWLQLGYGSALCDNEEPDSQCPVDGGSAFVLGGGWRLHRNWAVGLELGVWSFAVRDEWRGQLEDDARDVSFGSSYLALIGRWYFIAGPGAEAYLQLGIGGGEVTGEARNDVARYEARVPGTVYLLGAGVEWHLAEWFRLGPQLAGYAHISREVCENDGSGEECRSAGEDDNAVPWRLVVSGTFTF